MIGRVTDNAELCMYGPQFKEVKFLFRAVVTAGCTSVNAQCPWRSKVTWGGRLTLGFLWASKYSGILQSWPWADLRHHRGFKYLPPCGPTEFYLYLLQCCVVLCSGLERSNILTDFVSLGQDQVLPIFRRQIGRGPAKEPEDWETWSESWLHQWLTK